jgi:Ca-activated chloride channel family protein
MAGLRDRWPSLPPTKPLAVATCMSILVAVVTLVPNSWSPVQLLPGCISIEVSSSIETGKLDVLGELADQYNRADNRVSGRCVEVNVSGTTSGVAREALSEGWESYDFGNTEHGPEPQAWAPTSSMWSDILLAGGEVEGLSSDDVRGSIAQSLMVIAIPEAMARALGWPAQDVTWERIREMVETGWGSTTTWSEEPVGNPEWGDFRIGKDNPHRSTSGLGATVATTYAAAQVERGIPSPDLDRGDLDDSEIEGFVQGVEAGVRHYDDDIIDTLEKLARYDADGVPHSYLSAVLLQEQLVVEYNRGAYSPDASPGSHGTAPSERLVTFYPSESTLRLDHPYVILPSASAEQREAAEDFFDDLRETTSQDRLAGIGFRHREHESEDWLLDTNAEESIGGAPEVADASLREPPPGDMLQEMLVEWDELRKPVNILLVLDTSSSMDRTTDGSTRLEIMRAAVEDGLDELLTGSHDVGLWTFPGRGGEPYVEHVPIGPLDQVQDGIETALDGIRPGGRTPLYRTTAAAYDDLAESSQNEIDAVVVLTDGGNHDSVDDDLQSLVDTINAAETGDSPVQGFMVAYSDDAEYGVLEEISGETNVQIFDARDPTVLDQVFLEVVGNL